MSFNFINLTPLVTLPISDIEFTSNFVTLFQKNNFIGELDGNGKTLKNISISVTKDNFENYIYLSNNSPKQYSARIAVFGSTNGALIENLTFENLTISIDNKVVNYLKGNANGNFTDDYEAFMKEFIVGSVVGYATKTTLKVNVSAQINGSAFSTVLFHNVSDGINGVGGVVGYAEETTITNINEDEKANINISFTENYFDRGYYFGGVAGYLFKSNASNLLVTANVIAVSLADINISDNILYAGGIAGYVNGSNITNSVVNFDVKQVEQDHLDLTGITSINPDLYNKVAGIASIIRANNLNQISNFSNVTVNSTINMDCLFGGAVYEVKSTKYQATSTETETDLDKSTIFLTLENLILNSSVKVIKVYGFGAVLYYTNITYTDDFELATYNYKVYDSYTQTTEDKSAQYNLKITGSTLLTTKSGVGVPAAETVYAAFALSSNYASGTIHKNYRKDFHLIYSKKIVFGFGENTSINFYASHTEI